MPVMFRKALTGILIALAAFAAGSSEAIAGGQPAGHRIAVGVFIHNAYEDPALYDRYTREVGRAPVIIGAYKKFSLHLIDPEQLQAVWSRGAVPMVTWEPWGRDKKIYKLADIADGQYDGYIRRSARSAARWGKPIFVRFAHEMNGTWYPWGKGRHKSTPALYVAAWRHVVQVFREAGATNVKWVWSPNQNLSGRFPFTQYYPGDHWVDWVGIDGFNSSLSPSWLSFSQIFASTYNSIIKLTSRPIMVAETGSWEIGGSKSAWVRNALMRELPQMSHIRALVWWSVNDPRGDFRVNSSPRALAVFRNMLASPLYAADRAELLATPETLGPGKPVPVPGSHGNTVQEIKNKLRDNQLVIGSAILGFCLLVLVTALAIERRRRATSRRSA